MTNPKLENTNALKLSNLTRDRLRLLEQKGLARTDPEKELDNYYHAHTEPPQPRNPACILLDSIRHFYPPSELQFEFEDAQSDNANQIESIEGYDLNHDIDDEEWVYLFAEELGIYDDIYADIDELADEEEALNPQEMDETQDILDEMWEYSENHASSEEEGWFYDNSSSDRLDYSSDDSKEDQYLGWAWKEAETTTDCTITRSNQTPSWDEEAELEDREWLGETNEQIYDKYIDVEVRSIDNDDF